MTSESVFQTRHATALLGISAIGLFLAAFVVFSLLNPEFAPTGDYVSKLGAKGQPFARWWNLVGFVSVGGLLAAFGWAYGRIVRDRIVGVLFTLFGLGFIVTGVPTDMADPRQPFSKAHTVAICLALAAWLGGLARLAGSASLPKVEKLIANISATLVVLPMLGYLLGLWSMPMTHRLVFCVVFAWVVVASLRLLRSERNVR